MRAKKAKKHEIDMTGIYKNTWYIDEKDLMAVVAKIDGLKDQAGEIAKSTEVGNCGWANVPNCWYVTCHLTEEHRRALIDFARETGVKKYDPNWIY